MDDLSNTYIEGSQARSRANDQAEMESWAKTFDADIGRERPVQLEPVRTYDAPARPLPPPKPPRQETDDDLGRLPGEPGAAGGVMRSIAEIPKQVMGGIDDAARHALGFLDPLTNWLNDNVKDMRYDPVTTPKTTTGKITRSISEFFTGFIPAIRGLKAIGMTGNVAPGVLAGAIADFSVKDPHEGRLSNMWNEMGLPQNVLTDFLSSRPDDTGAEGRFKNALEGAVVGSAFEGILLAARALRAARSTSQAHKTEIETLRNKYGELKVEEFKNLGDLTKPAVQVQVVKADTRGIKVQLPPGDAGADELVGGYGKVSIKPTTVEVREEVKDAAGAVTTQVKQVPLEGQDVYINFARIDAPDDVKSVMQEIADVNKVRISEAQRGKITQAETEKLADDLGMTVTDLLARRKGQPFNAEQAVAARQLWAASGEKLIELAKKAESPNASPIEMYEFRKMMAVHAAIQDEVLGARTEIARALNSWKIPAGKGEGIERARAIEQIMQVMGGEGSAKEIAQRIAILSKYGDLSPAVLGKIAARGAGARTVDAIKEIFINSLLSSPKTHAVNIMSNTAVAFQQIYERSAASAIRGAIGGEGAVSGEATAMAFGLVSSIKDAFILAAKALKTGETGFAFNKVDLARHNAVSAEAFRISKESGMGRFIDFLGTTTRVPTRLLGAEDEFFKTIGYRMELHAQALRTAHSEGLRGNVMRQRMIDIINDPPEHIRINAADSAMYNTFTSQTGDFGRAMMNLRNVDSPLNPMFLVLPFIRTPVNIARYAFERTPFAPLVKQWRDDVAAGGARADLALARMSTGTAIMAMAMDWADAGIVSGQGPRDPKDLEALKRQGWQPYSMKVGDRWYSYNRMDPFGMTMGFAANIAEAIRKGEIDDEDVDEWQEVVGMGIAAVSQAVISKTYLDGVSQVVEVLSKPQQYSQSYVDNLVASFLPATSLNNSIKNLVDPVQREAQTPAEAIQARIAGLSDKLPPKRNLWGEELRNESGISAAYDFVSPIQAKTGVLSPIDREMVRLDGAAQRIAKKTSFDGVDANFRQYPRAYDEYVQLAGNKLKHPAWGMGAKDYLNAVVSGKHTMSAVYNVLPDVDRRSFIDATIRQYRQLAQQQLLQDPNHSAFSAEIQRLKQNKITQRMPVM